MIKFHYFDQSEAPLKDIQLKMAKDQGYVPRNCLLAGNIVMGIIMKSGDPCKGCEGPREKCNGRSK